MHTLGNYFERRCGLSSVGKDEKKAFEWYKRAADQGFIPARFSLGSLYIYGDNYGYKI